MALNSGTRLGNYEILASLGAGGMGEVYRARDSRLGREVALKVLPPEVTGDAGRLERFDREARAIAALNHPHIVTLYSTEEVDGIRFLTMELVEGQTLTELIVTGGLPIARFLELAPQLADALSAAHQKNITHRDLKPGNVMVSHEGRVKVLDFGLARMSRSEIGQHSMAATLAPITHLGMIVGTMPYMSPEQIEGRPIDPRSDLFSLGVIFYELLNGDRPFKGDSSPALMSAILRDTPSHVSDMRADVPESLARLIARCLEKRPEDRVQTARDVFNELRLVQKQLESGASATRSGSTPASVAAVRRDRLTVAVQAFTARSADEDAKALAEGLSDDLATGLARFSYLRVIARPTDARFLVDGSVRSSGGKMRITARLVDAASGAHLWSETFDRDKSEEMFAIQDEVAHRITATVADEDGVIVRVVASLLKQRPLADLSIDELVLRFHLYSEQFTGEEHGQLRPAFERALEREPRHGEAWAYLSILYAHELALGHNPLPDSIGRQRQTAERALELDNANQATWMAMMMKSAFARDLASLRVAADRILAINPLSGHFVASCAVFLAFAGDTDRAAELYERAHLLNPNHQGWYFVAPFLQAFRQRRYDRALSLAKRINMPAFAWWHLGAAGAAGHLGDVTDAKAAIEAITRTRPELLDVSAAREIWKAWLADEELVDRLIEGFEKASALTKPGSAANRPAAAAGSVSAVSAARIESDGGFDSAFLIDVRPFEGQGPDADTLAAGLSQSIAVGLSRYPYLRVLASATPRPGGAAGYTLQGSVRAAGQKVRVVAQLTEAATGTSVWANTFDRDLGNASLFDLQDGLTATIVATIADANGALVRSMANVVRGKPADALTPYEAVLRRLAYVSVLSPAEHALVRDALESATRRAPAYGAAWAALSGIYIDEYAQEYNLRPDPLGRAREAAHKALEVDASNQSAYVALALIAFFTRDMSAFHAAKDRALTLNPLDTGAMSLLGALTAYTGDWDAGLALSEKAMSLNRDHPGVYWMPSIFNRYRLGDYGGALDLLNRVTMPNYPNSLVVRAAIYGQLGWIDEGRALAREAEAKMPGITHDHTGMRRKWLPAELAARVQEGLDKLSARPGVSSDVIASVAGPSIAVLPFTDLSPNKDQDWFCDGIAEEILNALSHLPGLRVAARASTFALRGQSNDLRDIGQKLNVQSVLEGSVRRAGERVRITAQLSDVEHASQLWSERFDRDLEDIFDVQDEIARAIVERLKVTLSIGAHERLVTKATNNLDAYELLLRGRVLLTRRGHAIFDAKNCFEEAIALDPQLTEAHALLADALRLMGLYGLIPETEIMPRARAAAERALEIDPRQVEALATLANIAAVYDWDIAAALAMSDRALAINPTHVRALAERVIVLTITDIPAPALQKQVLESVGRARELDPLNAWVAGVEAFCQTFIGHLPEALAAAERSVALDENNFTARWTQTFTLAAAGRNVEAEQAAAPALAMSNRHPRILAELAAMHAGNGDVAKAEAIHQELHERAGKGYVGSAARAAVAASAGHFDEARVLVAQAIAARDSYLTFWKLPAWAPFWTDPECAALLRSTTLFQHRAG